MYLVQLLLPVQDSEGHPFNRVLFEELAAELTERFGGLTAYTRAPATGIWEERPGHPVQDHVVVYEVMTEDLEATWWATLRHRLEAQFDQEELVVRAQEMRRL